MMTTTMAASSRVGLFGVLGMLLVAFAVVSGDDAAKNVTYDGRSLIVDGERKILFSGSIHYPRSTPETWPSLIAKAKEGGIDVIQTYVFWNLHEPKPGQYDFSGRNDLVKFIKEVQSQGLYLSLRIGPFIEAEWNYGGFPFWLRDVPGIVYRTDNEPFKTYMQNFTTMVVNLMKSEGLYASQGGPIILSQIENEYANVEPAFHEGGPNYVRWAGRMATELNTGVPWVMCKQPDAPDPVINTCNGMRCGETFSGPNSPNKPSLWTENWTSFIQVYGQEPYMRSAEDIAFHVALFIARNGSFVNYYMYHGGTNFGRNAAYYFITGYYDQAPLDEYGLLRQPKYGHLKELHAVIKSSSKPLLYGKRTNFSLGPSQEAYVFEEPTGECVAFLVNNDTTEATVQFRNNSYRLLRKSTGILQDCKNMTFETGKVNTPKNTRVISRVQRFDDASKWEAFRETIPSFADTTLKKNGLLEHTSTTKDQTDYLWYTFSFKPDLSCTDPVLRIESLGHVVHVFVNNEPAGSGHGARDIKVVELDVPVKLADGANNISLVSAMVGLPDAGAYLEKRSFGPTKVTMNCPGGNTYNFAKHKWGYQVGLLGEKLQIYDKSNVENVEWSKINNDSLFKNQPFTWYKTEFETPGKAPVALNLTSMSKGEVWVNGQSIGRYWVSFLTSAGQPSQSMYHIPRAFMEDSGGKNRLVIMEEMGGDPLGISLDTISVIGQKQLLLSRPRLPH